MAAAAEAYAPARAPSGGARMRRAREKVGAAYARATRANAKRHARIFDVFDADGSNLLDRKEIKWLLPFYSVPANRFPELAEEYGDRWLNLATALELIEKNYYRSHGGGRPALRATSDDAASVEEHGIRWLVRAADKDHDGKVSKEEWINYVEEHGAQVVCRPSCCCGYLNIAPCFADCCAARYFLWAGHTWDLICTQRRAAHTFVTGGEDSDQAINHRAGPGGVNLAGREASCVNSKVGRCCGGFGRFAALLTVVCAMLHSAYFYGAKCAHVLFRVVTGSAFITDALTWIVGRVQPQGFTDWKNDRTCEVVGDGADRNEMCVGTCGDAINDVWWLTPMRHAPLCVETSWREQERDMKLATSLIVVLPVVWYGVKQVAELLTPSTQEQPALSARLIIFALALALVGYWSEQIEWDSKLKLSMFELPLAEIFITAFAVEYLKRALEAEKLAKDRAADWRGHRADRRRINVSLNMIDDEGFLAMRTLSEQPLSEVFPSSFVQNALMDIAETMDASSEEHFPHGSIVQVQRVASSGAYGFHRETKNREHSAKRMNDQITNFISSSHGPSGFIDRACGVENIDEVAFAWALTYEKLATKAQNQKFRVLLIRCDLLDKVLCKRADDMISPAWDPNGTAATYFKVCVCVFYPCVQCVCVCGHIKLNPPLPSLSFFEKMRWAMLRKMAKIYQQGDSIRVVKQLRSQLLMSITKGTHGKQLKLACRGALDSVERPWKQWVMPQGGLRDLPRINSGSLRAASGLNEFGEPWAVTEVEREEQRLEVVEEERRSATPARTTSKRKSTSKSSSGATVSELQKEARSLGIKVGRKRKAQLVLAIAKARREAQQ